MAISNPFQFLINWWNQINPDDRAHAEEIESGLRAPLVGSTESKYVTSPCQYWIKGLSAVCTYWANEKCNFAADSIENIPSGYGIGFCDGLGRREWCSKYTKRTDDDLDEYVCILPCIEKSGFGKQIENITDYVSFRSFKISEIKGYNEKDGVGQCDGKGMGRGSAGFNIQDIKEVYKKRPICLQYRPWSMGFGAITPRPLPEIIPETLKELHDGSKSDPLTPVERRLPFAFDIYNSRAIYQKCANWDAEFGSYFVYDENSGSIVLTDNLEPVGICKCTDEASIPYKTISEDWPVGVQYVLSNVWAEYGGIVCNGAKPECPCYTGKWVHCVDDTMCDGMRITANQILELRFWTSNWDNQEDYDTYFRKKPGPTYTGSTDETTSDIYTFTHWDKLNPTDPNESVMVGMKQNLCMPVPMNDKRFVTTTYVKSEVIRYPKLQEFYGTHAPGEVEFPTLVRALESPSEIIPQLEIIYPYYTINPWGIEPCNDAKVEDYCIHSCNKMVLPGPEIGILGYSVRNKEIYAININLINNHLVLLDILSYSRADKVPYKKRKILNSKIDKLIALLKEDNSENVKNGFCMGSTNSYGFFGFSTLKLKYEQINTIIILCKYATDSDGNSSYNFRVRKVLSEFYGGYISQTSFLYNIGSNSTSLLPTGFNPYPYMSGEVKLTHGNVAIVFSVFSMFWPSIWDEHVTLSYCINEYTDEVIVDKWIQVGATDYILAEIDNIDLSYVFDFDIIKATLEYFGENDNVCWGSLSVTAIKDSTLLQRFSIPPNAIVLKTSKILGFNNQDWRLNIKYKYQKLETFMAGEAENAVVHWPSGISDGNEGYYRFVQSPYTTTTNGSSFTVGGDGSSTFAVMAYIVDKNMRVQAAVATKLLSCVSQSGCRNVDIFYQYTADAVGYEPQPNSGFLTWRGTDRALTDSNRYRKHTKTPLCGDHECNPNNCIGPMWYPYDNCTTIDFYNIMIAAAQCTSRIVEGDKYTSISNAAWRYCQAAEYEAWVDIGGNWAASCGSSWRYYYSKANLSSMRFTGKARIRGPVDLAEYSVYGWTLPPFGNMGREYTERWLSKDYSAYLDLSFSPPVTRAEYMPHVIDDTDLVLDLNCFSTPDWHGPINEPFSHISQLSLFNASWINETVDFSNRYRFDDIFNVVSQSPCSYPYPLRGDRGDIIDRYGFKDEKLCWAWQEWWEEIERGKDKNITLNFVDLLKPDYVYDSYKKEHRLIADEGLHKIIFYPPEKDDATFYASISLDGYFPRFFKLLYNEADYGLTTNVEWVDENDIYEKTINPKNNEGGFWAFVNNVWSWVSSITNQVVGNQVYWIHDDNTLFDSESSSVPNDDRKIVVNAELTKHYNRGIIVNLPKNRLVYLPMEEKNISLTPSVVLSGNETYFTYSSDNINGLRWMGIIDEGVPIKIIIKGKWGKINYRKQNELNFCLPVITVAEHYVDDMIDALEFPEFPEHTIYQRSGKYANDSYIDGDYGSLYDYIIEINLSRLPTHMIKKVDFFQIKLNIMQDENLIINSIESFSAKYTKTQETIKIWERKYVCSTLKSDGLNPDGPDSSKYRKPSPSNKNNGQYFPFATATGDLQNEIKLRDKMTMVGASKFYPDSVTTQISSNSGGASTILNDEINSQIDDIGESRTLFTTISNLKTIERDEQQKLYKSALAKDEFDSLLLTPAVPLRLNTFLNKIGLHSLSHGNMVILSNKLLWENHNLVKRFIQEGLEFFTLGGHYFTWSPSVYKTRCYIFGPVESVYSIDFVHYKHGQAREVASAYAAYVGWVRVEYIEGRLAQIEMTQNNSPSAAKEKTDLLSGPTFISGIGV